MSWINLDVDGVVCDFVPTLFTRLRAMGFPLNDRTAPQWDCWDLFKVMDAKAREAAYEILKDPAFWETPEPVPGAKKAVESLRNAGHHIQWVTSPWESCFGWRDVRKAWLQTHFGLDSKCHDLTVAYRKAEVWADVFIDDKVENVTAWSKRWNGTRHLALVFATPHNQRDRRGAGIDYSFSWEGDRLKRPRGALTFDDVIDWASHQQRSNEPSCNALHLGS